jgi:hypothetical protein
VLAIGPQVPEPLEAYVPFAVYALMILAAAAAGFASYLTNDTGLSSNDTGFNDTGFRITELLFFAAFFIFVVIAVPRLDLTWQWKFYVVIVTLVLGITLVSIRDV